MPTGLEKSKIASEYEAAIRDTLTRQGWDADQLMRGVTIDVTDGRAVVLDLGSDPVKRVVALLTTGQKRPRKSAEAIRAEVAKQYAGDERQREKQRKLGLLT